MPMLDAYIPAGALSPEAEHTLMSQLTDLLLRHEGADPSDPRARRLAWVFLHRPADVYVAGQKASEPRYRIVASVPEGQFDEERRAAIVRADDPGVTLVDDWRGFGQRTTASGTAQYDRARADRGDVFPAAERFSYQAHFYQIAMLSVLTGITRAVLRDGSAALTERKRNYPQGLTEVPSADAQLLQVIGEVSADAFAAEAALARSSRSLDRIVTGRLVGDDEGARQRLIDAEVAVTQAQLVIIAAALQATTTIFDALGASGVSEERSLDRHWRNARTLASHNPRVYKARILGDWLINGKDPVADLASLGRGGQGN